jgi:hypothetical protein
MSTTSPEFVSIPTKVGSLKTTPRWLVASRVDEVPISSATSRAMAIDVRSPGLVEFSATQRGGAFKLVE